MVYAVPVFGSWQKQEENTTRCFHVFCNGRDEFFSNTRAGYAQAIEQFRAWDKEGEEDIRLTVEDTDDESDFDVYMDVLLSKGGYPS